MSVGSAPANSKMHCFAIADPRRAPGEQVQLDEERELQRARVLELVDDQQFQSVRQLARNVRVIDQGDPPIHHVREVDHTPLLLPVRVRIETGLRGFEDGAHEVGDVLVQTRVEPDPPATSTSGATADLAVLPGASFCSRTQSFHCQRAARALLQCVLDRTQRVRRVLLAVGDPGELDSGGFELLA